ncbi:MAG: hypothetical protein XU15_C0018G0047 [candidate division NC10 bacterium CSP1-5]|nr:MAG: hypothetical protein XU15_C0018G0047 [candidate division NC10 bacterium CSP1-5]
MKMKMWRGLGAGVAVSVLLWSGAALAQDKPAGCGKATPEKVEGQVVKIDPDKGKITVRATDGTTYEFEAAKETLEEYKVGDTIKAKLRSAPECP